MSLTMSTKDKGADAVAAVLAAKELHTLESITDDEFEAVLQAVLAKTGFSIPESETTESEEDTTDNG